MIAPLSLAPGGRAAPPPSPPSWPTGDAALLQDTLDALGAHLAVLDATGTILAVNAPWRRFAAANALAHSDGGVGLNYLAVCDQAAAAGDTAASVVAGGIRDVLHGRRDLFAHEDPCHSPTAERWFALQVTRLPGDGPPRVAVAHQDITVARAAADTLRARERDYRELLERAADAIVIVGPDARLLAVNARACALTGRARAELLGLALGTIMPLGGLGAATTRLAALADNVRARERTIRRRDGGTVPVEVSAARLAGGRVQLIVRDITARKALEARLARQATHDPLTGLPNRTLLLDRLAQALTRARRDGAPCAALFLDLDRFKEVNDTLGHDAGDRLLVAVAERLRGALREGDTLARLGGDEFVAVLEDVEDADAAAEVADRLAAALAVPLPLDGQAHHIAASVGIVLSTPGHTRPEDLLRDADIAMYRAKAAGGAGHALFDPATRVALTARVALERDLRDALEHDQFALHYQPIVDLADGAIIKVEALMRWHHPARGLVPPAEFIPLAEAAGLSVALGRWVLGAACRQARAWLEAGHPAAVAINLSAREFQDAALVGAVADALREAGLAARWLRLELTESLAMRDAAATVATLTALRDLGVHTAIDDFGTGYSSLAYLKRLPVDALKIDKAFVDGVSAGDADTAIAAAIVALGHTLGLRVIAEGVETIAQAVQLRALGCDLAQGYLFARALPALEAGALLRRGMSPVS